MGNKKEKIVRTATEALKLLWEEGFLRTWRKFGAIEEHLSEKGYHFSVPELGMALKRARHLTRRGKKGSYEYIQKHPFAFREESVAPKRAGRQGKS